MNINSSNENITVTLCNKGKWLLVASPQLTIVEVLTKQDKAKLVIELYKQGKNIREISKQVHMSFSDIGAIIRKDSGDDKPNEVKAYELFSEGLRPLDVIMKLNMKADEIMKLYTEYLKLCGLEKINDLYIELEDDIDPFIRLYKIMKEQGFGPEEIARAVTYGNDLPILELKVETLKEQLKQIEDEQENIESCIAVSRSVIANLDQAISKKTNELKSLVHKQQHLSTGILELMRSKDYTQVKEKATQHVNTILNDKKVLLDLTLFAVLQALRYDPEKRILIDQSYPIEQQRTELLELAENFLENLARQLVEATMNSAFGQDRALARLVIS